MQSKYMHMDTIQKLQQVKIYFHFLPCSYPILWNKISKHINLTYSRAKTAQLQCSTMLLTLYMKAKVFHQECPQYGNSQLLCYLVVKSCDVMQLGAGSSCVVYSRQPSRPIEFKMQQNV
jgi:hypothetical protein